MSCAYTVFTDRAVGVLIRIVMTRARDQPREHRGTREPQILGVDPEERPSGRLDTVRATTEVDGVQVPGQDLVLRQPILELPREGGLAELPAERPLPAGVQVLHELLGDRRAPL